MQKFTGLYRGTVIDSADPLHKRRIRVQVPDVSASDLGWAAPCVPVRSTANPTVGTGVWVMFEAGDPTYPVWIGTFPT